MKTITDLDVVKKFIKSVGPTEAARRSKIARRTLQYIAKGTFLPSYPTLQKLKKCANETLCDQCTKPIVGSVYEVTGPTGPAARLHTYCAEKYIMGGK